MTELKQNLRELENQISEMVFDFHRLNNIEPLLYKITPVFFENKRATGDRLIFIRHEVVFNYPDYMPDFQDKISPLIQSLITKVNEFCSENNITYLQGDINYMASMQNKLMMVNTELLIKP
jgi:hypothetical protein